MRRIGSPTPLLLAGDMAVAAGAFYLTVLLLSPASATPAATAPAALVFAGFVLLGLLSVGLYRPRQRPTRRETRVRVIFAMMLVVLACIVTYFVFPPLASGRSVLGVSVLLTGMGVWLVRRLTLAAVDEGQAKRRIVVLGTGQAAARISMLRRRSDQRRFRIVGYVPVNQAERESAEALGISPLVDLNPRKLRALKVDEIVVAIDERRNSFPVEQLLELKLSGIPVTEVVSFLERETEKIDLDVLHPAWLLFEHSRHTEIVYRWLKRAFDVSFALILLLLTAPLMLLAAIAIRLEDGRRLPVLYQQVRVGCHGRPFSLLKFRSMRADAEKDGNARWAKDDDDRITRTGHWLRRFRIDELPQLINIIRGDMSVVGPRPERPEFVEQLSAQVPLYYYRHCVRPGLAGWAQLNFPYGSSVDDAREKLKYDLYYVKNAGIITDMLILMQTAEVVFFGRGTAMAGRRRAEEPASAGQAEPEPAEAPAPEEDSGARRDAA